MIEMGLMIWDKGFGRLSGVLGIIEDDIIFPDISIDIIGIGEDFFNRILIVYILSILYLLR
jgi:hypothetical protein